MARLTLSCSNAKTLNDAILTRIIQLEHNAVTNSQKHSRRETTELSPVPVEINEFWKQLSVNKASSLTTG